MRFQISFALFLISALTYIQNDGGPAIKEEGTISLDSTVEYQFPAELKDKLPPESKTGISAHFVKTYQSSGNQLKVSFSDLEFQKNDGKGSTTKKTANDFIDKQFDIDCSTREVTFSGNAVAPELKEVLVIECDNEKRGERIRQFLQAASQEAHPANSEIIFPQGQNLVSLAQGPKLSVIKLMVQENTALGTEPIKLACQAELSLQGPGNSLQKEPLQGDILIFPTAKRITAALKGTTSNQVSLPDGSKIPTTVTIKFTSAETFQ